MRRVTQERVRRRLVLRQARDEACGRADGRVVNDKRWKGVSSGNARKWARCLLRCNTGDYRDSYARVMSSLLDAPGGK